mmetsp:Transcript_44782/g.130418  ORF Transcript_44782/g.130418 Transcript_44782/m.130418 type:complete len:224 (-) Transcript_44782:143-814(-)
MSGSCRCPSCTPGCSRTSTGYYYEPPYSMPSVAAPLAAAQRFDFSRIDFMIGGSLLYTLATGDFDGKDYTVQRWGNAVIIRRFSEKPDFVDLKNKGLQVEFDPRHRVQRHSEGPGLIPHERDHLLPLGSRGAHLGAHPEAVCAQGQQAVASAEEACHEGPVPSDLGRRRLSSSWAGDSVSFDPCAGPARTATSARDRWMPEAAALASAAPRARRSQSLGPLRP